MAQVHRSFSELSTVLRRIVGGDPRAIHGQGNHFQYKHKFLLPGEHGHLCNNPNSPSSSIISIHGYDGSLRRLGFLLDLNLELTQPMMHQSALQRREHVWDNHAAFTTPLFTR